MNDYILRMSRKTCRRGRKHEDKRKTEETAEHSPSPELIGRMITGAKYKTKEKSIEDCKDAKFFRDFLFRLKGISELGWKGAENSSRHGLGMEKIPRSIIKPDLPKIVTPDVTLLAFRASGNNLPFIGFRKNRNVFYVLYIEAFFGDIYNHN